MLRELLPFLAIAPPVLYGCISLVCARRFFSAPLPDPSYVPAVTILKPVKGIDSESYENFASFCRQDYPGYQIVFAVAAADDPVIPVVRQVMAAFPEVDIELVQNPAIHGPNYKVCNLVNAFPKAKHDIIVICDSDIRVEPDYLRQVCRHFSDPQVGLVTSLYRSTRIRNAATAVEALGFTAEMVPNVMAAITLEGLSFALGASMAVRREALEAIGGLASLVDYLADDYQLGNRVHLAGYKLALSGAYVESIMHREDLGSILARQLRWARTMRVSRPGGYFASGITQPFAAALLAVLVSGLSTTALLPLVTLYFCRSVIATIFSTLYVRDNLLPRWLWLLPLRDLLAFSTWLLSFFGQTVRWRGYRYRLTEGGKMVLVD